MLKVYELDTFYSRTRECQGICCVGTGAWFERMKELFRDANILDKILMCADNNNSKHSKEVEVGTRKLKILSVNEMIAKMDKGYVILITCSKYTEILEQLEQYDIIRDVDIVCLSHILALIKEADAMGKKIPSDIRRSSEIIIPKTIHYCWFGGGTLPDKNKRWMESWSKYCPDYEIKEWNEENYDVTKNEYMYEAYKAKKWGFVPDYARLDIIYNHGGIYLDTDVEIIRNIDDLLYQNGFAGFESNEYVNLGLGFGASKGMPLIREMRDGYDGKRFINADGTLNLIPSPQIQTKFLKRKGLQTNGEYQVIEDFTIYPEKVLSGKSYFTKRILINEFTRSIHHYDGSWVDEDLRKLSDSFEMQMSMIK